jgi:hypothetical protein
MMTTLKLALAAGVVSLATAASAQISNIQTATDAALKIDGANQTLSNPVTSPFYADATIGGAGYSTSAITNGGAIFFQAGSMSAGANNAASSVVELSFDVTNNTSRSITQAVSTVFESNFGMYVANFREFPFGESANGVDVKAACTGANLANCTPIDAAPGFSGIRSQTDTVAPFTLAYTEFLFEVVQDGNVLKTIGATLQLDRLANGTVAFTTGGGFDNLGSTLSNFEKFANFDDKVWSYSWDDTDVTVDLDPILVGDTSTITYRIRTNSWTDARYEGRARNTIVAFSCFADPVGRGGTSGSMFTIPGFEVSTCNDYRAGTPTEPTPYALKIPVLRNGQLVFTSGGVIPEPGTWAMLIVGFGLVGLSMRRGRKGVPAAAS